MTRIDWLTETTGKPVCEETRWAVRCRVPDSSVGMLGSGISCTAARTIREPSVASTTAPSIFASSRMPVAVNSTSSGKPPVQIDSTSLSLPSTMRAPVLPRRMRSRPSRSGVPGAIMARVVRSLSSRSGTATSSPRVVEPRQSTVACRTGCRHEPYRPVRTRIVVSRHRIGADRTDADLIAASLPSGELFAAVFDRHAGTVHRYLARRAGVAAADDLLAQTFLVAFESRSRYDPARPDALPWLYGIATNVLHRARRDELRLYRALA